MHFISDTELNLGNLVYGKIQRRTFYNLEFQRRNHIKINRKWNEITIYLPINSTNTRIDLLILCIVYLVQSVQCDEKLIFFFVRFNQIPNHWLKNSQIFEKTQSRKLIIDLKMAKISVKISDINWSMRRKKGNNKCYLCQTTLNWGN